MKKSNKNIKSLLQKQATSNKLNLSSLEINAKLENDKKFDNNGKKKLSEEEIMGEVGHGRKSGAMEKNLEQMVKVLNFRLQSLEEAAKSRMKLLEEDLQPNSDKMSKQASKIVDEFDEVVPRSLKDSKQSSNHTFKDNLVSSDTVFIDPAHLVLKTKQLTDAGKKLEMEIEDSFGTVNIREIKNKTSKNLNQSEKAKKSEQLKNEAKRINRMKFEKRLQINMENFVTRSVVDHDFIFDPPSDLNEEAKWPVTIKWCSRDPRSKLPENHDGEFEPDLLLRYSIEKVNLPSGKKLFTWLISQPIIQRYFVYLFWIIKVKFFESEKIEHSETFLLYKLSIEFRRIVELLAIRSHAEHEKDFVYKFLPFILSNGIFFGFYYVFPGSRHLYTKGFKKTVYMQVIQLMYGMQICPISVKVSWAKLFPEDIHDDEDGEDGGELFPVQLALKEPKFNASTFPQTNNKESDESDSETLSQSTQDVRPVKEGILVDTEGLDDKPFAAQNNEKNATISFPNQIHHSHDSLNQNSLDGNSSVDSLISNANKTKFMRSASIKRFSLSPVINSSNLESSGKFRKALAPIEQLKKGVDEFLDKSEVKSSLTKTYLKPPALKPSNKAALKRQNVFDSLGGQDISPQMELYFSAMDCSTAAVTNKATQSFRRTIPVSWCPAGGSDTHHKRTIHTDLHNEISGKLKKSMSEYTKQSNYFHRKKIESAKELEKTLEKIMGSGQTNISRYSLDLIRRQKNNRSGNTGSPNRAPSHLEEVDLAETALLAQYDDEELERFIAEI